MGIAAIIMIAAGVWAVSEFADSDSSERRGSGVRVPLTDEQAETVERIALEDEAVQRLAAGRDSRVVSAVPWLEKDQIVGARVEIVLDPPIKEFNAAVPALLEPNEDAPPGTPNLNRELRYKARNVSLLSTRVDLGRGLLVAIAPSGSEAEILDIQLVGPKVEKYYYGKPD
jgi:hypothetical protein